ncbi:hypothetical protein F5884DRAFT_784271 [Xylogone sp. PMI_703]|nr:hypothetical protein F5884DRAFT_784271 [Xylogone sp. PMI_703]
MIRSTSPPAPTGASPASPTRGGRLRGLSYLRTYTHNHILSRDNHNSHNSRTDTLTRTTSHPSPTSPASPGVNTLPASSITQTPAESVTASQQSQDNTGATSGWFPSVGGSGVSRISSEPQVIGLSNSSADPIARTNSADMPQNDVGDGGIGNSTPTPNTAEKVSTPNGVHQLPSIRFSAHQDPRAQRPSLVFSPMSRILPTGKEVIKVGRYSERDNQTPQAINVPSAAPVGFKSKVVSRRHCEFWYQGGRWFIKDVKSSSGTFLNHIRLSSPGTESRPFPVNDGDIVQLGIDFKGGEEMIFRCVKIRIELNKGWQTGPSSFNVQSHKRLRDMTNQGKASSGPSQDCSICLGPIAPCQSLFVAPCSHTWHYKCIRVIINGPHWPHFICPNCRTVADLEAELEDPYADGEWEEFEGTDVNANAPLTNGVQGPSRDQPDRQAQNTENSDSPQEDEHHGGQDAQSDNRSDEENVDLVSHAVASIQISEPPSSQNNSTVNPVNIANRKVAANLDRTPSPNDALPTSIAEAIIAGEGPMTPRNNAGPFVLDGGAGEASGVRITSLASLELDTEENGSQPQASS